MRECINRLLYTRYEAGVFRTGDGENPTRFHRKKYRADVRNQTRRADKCGTILFVSGVELPEMTALIRSNSSRPSTMIMSD